LVNPRAWLAEGIATYALVFFGPNGLFDSSLFMSGTTFEVTFTEKGEYPYFDMVHPWITGKIIVM